MRAIRTWARSRARCTSRRRLRRDPVDRLGHGTAVAAAIREKVPEADLFAVKIFDRRLSANIDAFLRALRMVPRRGHGRGQSESGHGKPRASRAALRGLARRTAWWSAQRICCRGACRAWSALAADEKLPARRFRRARRRLSGVALPAADSGVPPERNLHGVSFAVANMTGFVAVALALSPRGELLEQRCGRYYRRTGG